VGAAEEGEEVWRLLINERNGWREAGDWVLAVDVRILPAENLEDLLEPHSRVLQDFIHRPEMK
jgi:hypothetical protein